jgi:hypothetical protein
MRAPGKSRRTTTIHRPTLGARAARSLTGATGRSTQRGGSYGGPADFAPKPSSHKTLRAIRRDAFDERA